MARKTPSFRQLIDYMSDIEKSDEQYSVYQNLYSRNNEDLESEFLRNVEYMKKRKNGNFMYHEILSITKAQKLDEKQQKKILRSVAYEYAKRRAENNLIFGTLHDDHDDHLHYHLLISANALNESKKTRLSKTQFDKLKKEMEARVLKHHPELEQKVVINQQAEEKLSRKGAEQKRRTGKTPQRDELKAKLQEIFSRCDSKEDFFSALSDAGLEFYVRGKTMGVKDLANDRKHRLKTLGLLDEFNSLSDRIEMNENQSEQKQPKEDKASTEKQSRAKKTKTEDPIQKQEAKRKAEAEKIREQRKVDESHQNKDEDKPWLLRLVMSWVKNQVHRSLINTKWEKYSVSSFFKKKLTKYRNNKESNLTHKKQ